jgi:hypothetical protein
MVFFFKINILHFSIINNLIGHKFLCETCVLSNCLLLNDKKCKKKIDLNIDTEKVQYIY